ncbi:MAG: response regulator transcription factor [Oscillospiraceae bacterium]|nr:response regulator transcription factor [Oscillospiraceae bacterium]MCI9317757.1 response regulator transcription factor [Oscillospiraceae bacterium]
MANILIVEDEAAMGEIIADYMRNGGHACLSAGDGVEAMDILRSGPVDLMILDVMMPHLDGFSVCKMAREASNMPIIMLTARGEEDDKLRGYGCGADDYMTKPFSPRVLLAKVNALLRRSAAADVESVSAGEILLQPRFRRVCLRGGEIALTHKEYELLALLMAHPGQVFSREQLLSRIWGYDFEGTTRTVDTHVKTLRQKLGDEGRHIVTLIRSGYKFEVAE